MNLIETKPVGDANFYKFSVDFVGDDFILGGKTLPLGIITHDILNIPADRLLSVFKTGDKLNDLYNRLNAENYSDELFTSIRKTVEKILDIIGKIKPFSYFNISEEYEHIDLLLGDDKIKEWQRSFSSLPIPNINFVPEGTAMYGHIIVLTEFIKSYIYLCADTFNFYKVAMMYFVNLTENGFRDKVLLAGFTKEFFGKEEVAEQFREGFPEDVLQPGKAPGKYQLDLWKANQSILLRAGIQPEHMAVTNVCTCHNPEYLFSHRASHGQRGNLAAFLMLKESWVPECLTGIKKI